MSYEHVVEPVQVTHSVTYEKCDGCQTRVRLPSELYALPAGWWEMRQSVSDKKANLCEACGQKVMPGKFPALVHNRHADSPVKGD